MLILTLLDPQVCIVYLVYSTQSRFNSGIGYAYVRKSYAVYVCSLGISSRTICEESFVLWDTDEKASGRLKPRNVVQVSLK